MSSAQGRKRNRNTLVCVFCKKRKVKCDKGQPCSSCVKYGEKDCVYEKLGISDTLKSERDQKDIENEIHILSNKIRRLQDKLPTPIRINGFGNTHSTSPSSATSGDSRTPEAYRDRTLNTPFGDILGNNPIAHYDDKLSFGKLTGTTIYRLGLRRSYSAFTSLCLVKNDAALNVFLYYLHNEMFINKNRLEKPSSTKEQTNTERTFESKSESIGGVTDLELYPKSSQSNTPLPTELSEMNQTKEKLEYVDKLSTLIISILPERRVIWKLIDSFFTKVYPLYPILDQKDFSASISRMIGDPGSTDTRVTALKVEKRMDFATLGILLLVLRLSYLSLIPNDLTRPRTYVQTDPDRTFLVEHPIKLNFFMAAKKCLELFDLFTTSSLTVLQLTLLHRLYYMLAPEEGDHERSTEVIGLNGIVTNMATCLGIHRERAFSFSPLPSPRQNNLLRKIWYVIYQLNAHHAIFNGSKIFISESDFDIPLPYYESGIENIHNVKLEEAVIGSYAADGMTSPEVRKLLDFVSNFKDDADMYELSQTLETLESKYIKYYGFMLEKITGEKFGETATDTPIDESIAIGRITGSRVDNEVKTMVEVRTYQAVLAVELPILHLFVNYYEKKSNAKLMSHYLKKLLITITYELVPFCFEVLHNYDQVFPTLSDLIIVPELVSLLHSCVIIIMSLHLREKVFLFNLTTKPGHYDKMSEDPQYQKIIKAKEGLLKSFQSLSKSILDRLARLGGRYFSAWNSNEKLSVFMDYMIKNDILEFDKIRNIKQVDMGEAYLHELYSILQTSDERLKQVVVRHKDEVNHFDDNVQANTSNNTSPTTGNEQVDTPEWAEFFQFRSENQNQSSNDFMNIANYENMGFEDNRFGLSTLDNSFFDGTSLDQILKDYLDSR